jgi:D-alanine-D-alanine ligase
MMDPDPEGAFISELKSRNVSMVFIALHGGFGEDGTIQRMLETAGINYTGPGPACGEASFDKAKAQALFKKAGVLVPDYCVIKKNSFRPAFQKFPIVVKPAKAGSSVGISIIHETKDMPKAIEQAFLYSDEILIEEFISGRELTVGILGDEALPVVEIIAQRDFYDFEAKYKDAGTRYEVPAQLTASQSSLVTEMALKAYRAIGGQVMSRVDIILNADNKPYVLEINTIPGLTGKSLLPKAAKAKGLDFGDLCVRILELSLQSTRV